MNHRSNNSGSVSYSIMKNDNYADTIKMINKKDGLNNFKDISYNESKTNRSQHARAVSHYSNSMRDVRRIDSDRSIPIHSKILSYN